MPTFWLFCNIVRLWLANSQNTKTLLKVCCRDFHQLNFAIMLRQTEIPSDIECRVL